MVKICIIIDEADSANLRGSGNSRPDLEKKKTRQRGKAINLKKIKFEQATAGTG
jgi:hypothetical protein